MHPSSSSLEFYSPHMFYAEAALKMMSDMTMREPWYYCCHCKKAPTWVTCWSYNLPSWVANCLGHLHEQVTFMESLCLSSNIKLLILSLKEEGQSDPGHCFKNAKAELQSSVQANTNGDGWHCLGF